MPNNLLDNFLVLPRLLVVLVTELETIVFI